MIPYGQDERLLWIRRIHAFTSAVRWGACMHVTALPSTAQATPVHSLFILSHTSPQLIGGQPPCMACPGCSRRQIPQSMFTGGPPSAC